MGSDFWTTPTNTYVVQRKSRLLAASRQDPFRVNLSPNQVYGEVQTTLDRAKLTNRPADLGLQVLDNVIMTRWKVLPREQCLGSCF